MSKIAHYLQEHLVGEVTDSLEVRRTLNLDASILEQLPAAVVYPATEEDVRKCARFAWQLAQRQRLLPLTPRGGGSSTTGGAIGSGLLMQFGAHLNRILDLDTRKSQVRLEPGITYGVLQQTLYTHGLFLPAYPVNNLNTTVGGGIATNVAGERSAKYGNIAKVVKNLRLVLANGEVIETELLDSGGLNKKLGLSTMEGEIYRALDALLEENAGTISRAKAKVRTPFNGAGYNLWNVKADGGFDLTPLLVGSEGTLGIITEATLDLAVYDPHVTWVLASIPKLKDFNKVWAEITQLEPDVCDFVNKAAYKQIGSVNPSQLKSAPFNASHELHLFIEFSGKSADQQKSAEKLQKIINRLDGDYLAAESDEDYDQIQKLRRGTSSLLLPGYSPNRALPVAEDISVPVDELADFLARAAKIYDSVDLPAAMWGHAASGIIKARPVLDVAQLGDRQKIFKLQENLFELAAKLGGSISASGGDGKLHAPYLQLMYGPEYAALIARVKAIFDPHGFLNPGVKTASVDDVKALMRSEYRDRKSYPNLPRS